MSDSEFERELEAERDLEREQREYDDAAALPPSPSDFGDDDEHHATSTNHATNSSRRAPRRIAMDEDEDEEEDNAGVIAAGAEEASEAGSEEPHPDDVSEDLDEMEFDDLGSDASGGVFRRRVEHDDDDDDDAGGAFDRSESGFGGAASASHLLNQGLNHLPGWSEEIHGANIDPVPPIFRTALAGTWSQWTSENPPFALGQKIRPARVLKVGFIPAWQLQKDAEYVGDFEAQADEAAQARTIANCALMGMLTMGTAKGFLCSDNHSELAHARASNMEPEEVEKLRQRLNGKLKSYTYCPNSQSNNPAEREQTAMQFCWGLCYGYDEHEKFNGLHLYQLIFDKGFSNDELARKLMEENSDIKRSGLINGLPEHLRKQSYQRQNQLQRSLVSDDDLGRSAGMHWKRVCTNGDWLRMLESVGGKTTGNPGRPFYGDIANDTPPGCQIKEFTKDAEFGGRHPIGPTISHNHKRFLEPGRVHPAHPGVNVSLAGTLDAKGKPLGVHPSLRDPRDWYDAHGNFEPPQHVRDNGWFYICHDPSVTNLFRAPLPHKMHGSVEPADCLLKIFWDLHKDTSPILKKMQERGKRTWEENRDTILRLFHREQDAVDPDQARLMRAVQDTDMLSNDSLDKTSAEEQKIEFRAYRSSTEQHGDVWTISARQIFCDLSAEQEKLHAMVQEHDKRRRTELSSNAYAAQHAPHGAFDVKAETRKRQRDHAEATDAAVRLGLQRWEHAYERKKARKMIPPGWYDVAHVGLRDALKEAGEIAERRAASGMGRIVDPEHPDAAVGTANIGQAHGKSYVATDFTTFGEWRGFLMHLFSAGVRIAGSDVKLMLECYLHAFEPFQEVSFFFLMCGGPGTGKSMRAKRMMTLLCDGWVKGSGSASMKAGMNGGMDYLCGRLVYYDEITNDFASNDSERIEYLKSITMEQRVHNTRTIKMAGEGGLDTFVTVVIDSLHFESHVMCTNCGPLGLKGDQEPSTNRAALSDRSWAHMVPPAADDNDQGDVDFDLTKASDDVKAMVNKFRVHTCLVAYVLIFIRHMPSCRPNLTYANMLCNKWYDMLDREINIPKPTKRKKIKLRMMLELFAVESAVYEKFMVPESGIDFKDMRPDENGHLTPFCIEQLADVVRSLQRCLDLEAIVTAWSHSLDHSPATCSHVQQMMSTLSSLVGNEFDRRTLVGSLPPADPAGAAPSPAPSSGPQGRAREPSANTSDAELSAMMDQFEAANQVVGNMMNQYNQSAAPAAPAAPAPPPPPAPPPAPPGDDAGPMHHENGNVAMSPANFKTMMGEKGKTRQQCLDFAQEMELQRQCRAEMSSRAMVKKLDSGCDAHAQLTKLFTDGRDRNKEPMHRMTSTGEVISAKRAAGACMPTAADLMGLGMDEGFLKKIVAGMDATKNDFESDAAQIGTKCGGWEYKRLSDAAQPGPADFDFSWARLKGFAKSSDAAAAAGNGGATGAANKKSIWTNTARVVKAATKTAAGKTFSMMDAESMSHESMRDTLFIINGNDNKRRIPQSNPARRYAIADASRMLSQNQIFTEAMDPKTIHPHCMYVTDPNNLNRVLDPNFCNAKGIERPLGSTAATSDYHKRLDHLVSNRALPVAIAPESYKRGSPLEECEAFNGVYFNKHIASEQANLVVEIAHFLSTVPGIAGGVYEAVPDTFKAQVSQQKGSEADKEEHELNESRKQVASAPARSPTPSSSHGEVGEDNAVWLQHAHERDPDEDLAEPEDALPVQGDEDYDLRSVDQSVSNPDSEQEVIHPTEGAAQRVANQTVNPDAMQQALPYEWDQFGMWATCKVIDTLHNDCRPYVDKMRAKFPDVFGKEDAETTCRDLPQICMRFPGLEEKDKVLYPLSRGIPLQESRFCDIEKHVKSSRASKEITEAAHSFAHGRAIAYNDPEVAEHEAAARGVDSGFSMKGNLFARSTWQRFTLSALEARGMYTPEEVARVNDQGLCLRWRVRNHRAVTEHVEADPALDMCTMAVPKSFTAQERRKRERGDADDDGEDIEVHGSHAAKKRQLEQQTADEMLVDDCDADPFV